MRRGSTFVAALWAVAVAADVFAQDPPAPQRPIPEQPAPQQPVPQPLPRAQLADPTVADAELQRAVGQPAAAGPGQAAPSPLVVSLRALVASSPERSSALIEVGGVQVQAVPGTSFAAQGRAVRVESLTSGALVLVDELRGERMRLELGAMPQQSAAGKLARVDLRAVDLQSAARVLADQSGLNIAVSAAASTKTVSLYLADVDPLVAVRTLCEGHQLWWRRDKETGVVRISTAEEYHHDAAELQEERTEAFTLHYPNVFDIGRALRELYGDRVLMQQSMQQQDDAVIDLANRLSRFDLFDGRQQGFGQAVGSGVGGGGFGGRFGGGLGVGLGGGYGGYGGVEGGYSPLLDQSTYGNNQYQGGNQGTIRPEQPLDIGQIERIERRLRQLEGARPEDVEAVRALQKDAMPRYRAPIFVTIAPRQNKLVVRTSDLGTLDQIRALVRELDVPTALVLLEVRVLAIDNLDGFESFFEYQWADGTTAGQMTTGTIAPPAPGALGPGGTGLRPGDLVFQYVDSRFAARMQLLERENRVRSLATPVLLTANNEVSRLFVGQEVPINRSFIGGATNQNESTTVTSSGTTGIEFRPVGTTLLMTPSINSDRTVSLQIVQETSNANATADVLVPQGDGFVTQQVNVISSQSVSGTIVAKSDLAVAFGGLIETGKSDSTEKVPLLGDIPLLGFLFRRDIKESFRREIVVIVKPYVIGTPSEQVDRSVEVLRTLGVDFDRLEQPLPEQQERAPTDKVFHDARRPGFRVHGIDPPKVPTPNGEPPKEGEPR